MNILFLTQNLSGNSTGRTYALWLAAEHLGWRSRTLAIRGDSVWAPLRDTSFAAACARVSSELDQDHSFAEAVDWADLIVLVKPVASTLGLYIRYRNLFTKPILLDIDDPDLESALAIGRPIKAVAKMLLRPREMKAARERHALTSVLNVMVSNPSLQRAYGGTIVPHARIDPGFGSIHSSTRPQIAFVGTNNPHKGIGSLRTAVAAVSGHGFTLTITDAPPADAKPWERWIGRTSLQAGIELVQRSDIVALPSSAKDVFARGQLPAKLMDAMLAGRAIVASDLEPIAWALNGTGLLVKPDSHEDLTRALSELSQPSERDRLGRAARERALSTFEVTPVAAQFSKAATLAIESWRN